MAVGRVVKRSHLLDLVQAHVGRVTGLAKGGINVETVVELLDGLWSGLFYRPQQRSNRGGREETIAVTADLDQNLRPQ